MSYMALYRKWRPDEFEEVKGQEHIVTTLKNQIKYDRIGHAYLFCGTRGTGKTTVAKLLAKAVNCENPVDGSPCNECASCKAIKMGASMNVIEIDAASNNGVDNIRQINDTVQYTPSQGKYLVYIIDEVHMLSSGAFNALLKTLEEPPSYVIFILATTESHKIPITISSRCQRYDFHRITIETITDRLEELLKREEVPATRDALTYVAKAADGSMRDALSILDQCIAFNLGEELTFDRVQKTIGAVNLDKYVRLIRAVLMDEPAQAMDIIAEVVTDGKDLMQFVSDFIMFIRNILFMKMSDDIAESLELTEENVAIIRGLANDFSEEELLRFIKVMQDASVRMRDPGLRRVTLEMAVIRLLRPEMSSDNSALISRIDKLEKKLENMKSMPVQITSQVVTASEAEVARDKDSVAKNISKSFPEASKEDIDNLIDVWNREIIPGITNPTKNYLKRAEVVPDDNLGTLNIYFPETEQNAYDYINTDKSKQNIKEFIEEKIKRTIKLNVIKSHAGDERKKEFSMLDINNINWDNIELREE